MIRKKGRNYALSKKRWINKSARANWNASDSREKRRRLLKYTMRRPSGVRIGLRLVGPYSSSSSQRYIARRRYYTDRYTGWTVCVSDSSLIAYIRRRHTRSEPERWEYRAEIVFVSWRVHININMHYLCCICLPYNKYISMLSFLYISVFQSLESLY